MVAEFTGVVIDADELGGAAAHARFSGAASLVVADRAAAEDAIAELLALPPGPQRRRAAGAGHGRPVDRPTPELRDADAGRRRPAATTSALVIDAIVDDGELLELRPRWAPNLVTAVGHDRRPARRHRRQPADGPRRHARHPRQPEGRPVRRLLRRLQPAAHHPRRHARLLPGQGPRVAGHDPPRRPARVRLRPGHRAPRSASSCARATAAPTSSWTPSGWATTSAWPGRVPSSP